MSSAPRLPGHPLVMAEMEGWVAGTSSLDSSLALFSWRSHQAIFWLQSGFYYNYSKARNWGSCANMNLSMCKALPILGLQKGRQTLNHDDITKALPTGGWWASVSSPLPALQTCGSSYFPLSLTLFSSSLSVQIRKPREWICEWHRAFLCAGIPKSTFVFTVVHSTEG